MLSVLTACASGMLSEWLATHSVGIGDRLSLVGNGAVSIKAVEAGETLLELQAGACLTARAAYADREMGRELQSIAERVGPGFDTVALAAFVATERVRGFEAETWYAGSAAETVGVDGARQASAWSPLTAAHWAAEARAPSSVDPELVPLVRQGITYHNAVTQGCMGSFPSLS